MPKKQPKVTTDGVVQRRRQAKIGDFENPTPINIEARIEEHPESEIGEAFTQAEVEDLDNSDMPDAKEEAMDKSKKQSFFRRLLSRRKNKRTKKKERRKHESKKRKYTRRTVKSVGYGVLAIFVFLFAQGYLSIQDIIDRDGSGAIALGDVDPSQLRGEGDGRVNILLIGIGGAGHEGGNLADTIIVASIDPIANEVAMLSIPRDLYVDIPGFGPDRINAAHAFGQDYTDEHNGGIKKLRETVEQTLDIKMHYYVRVDFKGIIDAVDAVGGVDIDVKDPIVNDYKFAWMNDGQPLNVPKGIQHMDGMTALMYARSRYTSARGDFDRSVRQQEVLIALKDKVLSAGTFADPRRLSGLLSSAGGHVKTNIQIPDMLRIYEISEQVPNNKILSAGLSTDEDSFLTGANMNGASVLVPKSGSFLEIQEYVRELFIDGFIRQEKAKVDVLNGTKIEGIAGDQAELLLSYGYNVKRVKNAPTRNYGETFLYNLSGDENQFTQRYLEQRYGKEMLGPEHLPKNVKDTSDFVIIFGKDAAN